MLESVTKCSNRRRNARIDDSWFSFRLLAMVGLSVTATVSLLVMDGLSAMVRGLIGVGSRLIGNGNGLIGDGGFRLGYWRRRAYQRQMGYRRR
nr:hypothetical protein CFP56_27398 [Quercus suber]